MMMVMVMVMVVMAMMMMMVVVVVMVVVLGGGGRGVCGVNDSEYRSGVRKTPTQRQEPTWQIIPFPKNTHNHHR